MMKTQESTPLLTNEKSSTLTASLHTKHIDDPPQTENYDNNSSLTSSTGKSSEIIELDNPQDPRAGSEQKSAEGNGRKQWITIMTLLTLVFLTYCIDICLISFFTDMALQKGLQESQVGVIFSSYDISRFIGASFIAYQLAESPPRLLFSLGSLVTALPCVAFGLVGYINNGDVFFAVSLILRLISGLGSGVLITSTTTVFLHSTNWKPASVVAAVESTTSISSGLAPAIGSFLHKYIGGAVSYIPIGMLTLFVGVLSAFILKATELESSTGTASIMVKNFGVILMFCTIFAIKTCSHGTLVYLPHFLISELEVDSALAGMVFLLGCIGYAFGNFVTGKLINKYRLTWSLLMIGWITMAVLYLFRCPSPLLNFIFHGRRYASLTITEATFDMAIQTLIYIPPVQILFDIASEYGYDQEDVRTCSLVSGVIYGGISCGAGVGPIVFGVVNQFQGYETSMTLCFIMMLIMGFVTSFYRLSKYIHARYSSNF